jgi:serine/threonine protein kinase/TPR repeat protein
LVALKVLPDTLLHDSASLDSLKRETKLGRSMAHPNIVRIHDFQNDENAAAISMEYVDGGNLSDLRIKKPSKVLNPSDLAGWLGVLFDGLDYAHNRQRIVHRDLKPRNLMLNSRGELKIADFGISRSISDSMTMLTGMLASTGSPPYVSPQQWDGERPTPLDDIYSLGATLYELLTSKPPLLGVLDWQQVHHKLAPPMWQRRLILGIKGADPIPAQWEETVAACLAKDPKDRPQSVRELKARLLIDLKTVSLTDIPLADGEERNPLILPTPEVTPWVADDIDDSSEKTIKCGVTLSDHLGQASSADDEGFFDEPTLRHIRGSSAVAEPSDDIETGATLRNWRTEPTIARETTVRKPKKIPAWFWLIVAAVGLLGALAYIILGSGEPVIPAPLAVHGELIVESDPPGAMITLDNNTLLKSPHTFKDLKGGGHQLTATLEGYLPAQRDLQSDGRTALKVALTLEKEPPPAEQFGTLSVTTNIPGAVISLDDNPPNEPPNNFTHISLGTHRLTATLDGYEPIYQELQIDTTETVYKVLQLKRTRQWLRLQELVEEVKKYTAAPDSPEYITACAKYLQHLNLADSSPSPELPPPAELKQDLEKIIQGVRTHQAPMRPSTGKQEFQKYKDAITSAAQLDILQAILMLAENETESHTKFSLFEKAATQKNDPGAMMMLGILYAKSINGVVLDYEKGLDWLQKAAKAGNNEAAAYYYEGYLFGQRKRGEAEQMEAVESLKDVFKQGVPHAGVALGEWFRRKAIDATDKATRLKLYREAADWWWKAKGPREWRACYYLGDLYENGLLNEDGRPTQDDLNEAKALYQEGAANEDVICMFNLGRFTWEHSENQDEMKQALSLIRCAAALRNPSLASRGLPSQ